MITELADLSEGSIKLLFASINLIAFLTLSLLGYALVKLIHTEQWLARNTDNMLKQLANGTTELRAVQKKLGKIARKDFTSQIKPVSLKRTIKWTKFFQGALKVAQKYR